MYFSCMILELSLFLLKLKSEMVPRIFLILCFACNIGFCVNAKDNEASGLLFKSKTESIDERTSLDLFNGNSRCFKNDFSISFDISIWDIQRFGYILRLINEKQEEISFVFVNFRGESNLYFDFNSGITNKSIQIPILKSKLARGQWLNVKLHFDPALDQASIHILEQTYVCENVGLSVLTDLRFVFGLYGINLDVPAMALRNIKIEEKNQVNYFFPLNEAEGNHVHDGKGRKLGYVKNPIWLLKKHHNWELIASFMSESSAGVTYNRKAHELMVINRDSINIFNPRTLQYSKHNYDTAPFSITSGEAIYSEKKDKCYVYNLNDEKPETFSFMTIDMHERKIDYVGDPNLNNKLHHHNVFFDTNEDTLYIFGGYGNFNYSNKLYRYEQTTDNWVEVPVSGDTITPRFFAAAGKGKDDSELLIFGGFGNESGRQELGGRNLYDLISLDIKSKSAKKRWENNTIGELFVPCGNLIVNQDNTHFYTLCYPHHLARTELKLYKFSIADGSYEIVSNAIPVLSEEINTSVYLFYDDFLQEYYAVIREFATKTNSEIRIHSLTDPPLTADALINYPNKIPLSYYWIVIPIIVLIVVVILLFKRKRKQDENDVNIFTEQSRIIHEDIIKKNAIYVLGDFLVFDKNGMDITYRFSTKLRFLFSIILFNSDNNIGISTEKLTADLWPDRELTEAKNIRGVTVNHLRNVIADMEGIELIHKNSRWHFAFTESFYCDYTQSVLLAQAALASQNEVAEQLDKLLNTIQRGNLFFGLEASWLDNYKSEYENLIEATLRRYINISYRNKDYKKAVDLIKAFFMIDPLNEEILVIAIKSLRKLNKVQQSQAVFSHFCTRYNELMGEKYRKSYAELILEQHL